ncbi:Protein srg1 [Stylosanthes scabra]|uniref:Protein srg1 n=1 Tax=Stylosanthes scabra TaxID=79078 RepID=A0ABU6R341_9FABA|nr:Protein srg1 [Stylosanthes scabra]
MEEMKKPLLASILVPSVQELVKEKICSVPQRYVHHDVDEDLVISEADGVVEIPVIDMHRLLSIEFGDSELSKLHSACKEWGFFQVVNHGVSSSLVEKVKLEIKDFFNLPMVEKKKFWQSSENVEGFGHVFGASEEQKLDWADMLYMTTLPKHMRVPHLFPQFPLPFRDTLELYSEELKKLGMNIIAQMGKALKMEEKEMRELFEDGTQTMRMNYYPPCPEPEKVIGLTPHSDGAGLTILLQVSEVEGLQIRKDGIWVPVKPLPNSFIINLGDMLEIISNGIYQSIEHRVMVNSEKERLSIATFYSPRFDGIVGPAPSLITEQSPAQFKTIGVQEYRRGLFASKLEGKSYRDIMRINHHMIKVDS